MVPPLTLGVLDVMVTPLVSVMFSGENVSEEGATALTVMFTLAEVEPPELFAHTV